MPDKTGSTDGKGFETIPESAVGDYIDLACEVTV